MADATTDTSGETPDQTPANTEGTLDARRARLRSWIASKDPVLADLYEGAVIILLGEPPIAGWPYFTSHTVREIRNRFPDAVAGKEASTRVRYEQDVKELGEVWKDKGLQYSESAGSAEVPTSTEEEKVVPGKIYEILSRMVQKDATIPEKKYAAAQRLFKALVPEGEYGEKEPIILQWVEVTNWFEETAHVGRSEESIDRAEYIAQFEKVEHILGGLMESSEDFSQLPAELNEILENTNN